MRIALVSSLMLATIAACNRAAPPPPAPPPMVTGTLVCEPPMRVLGSTTDLPDTRAASEALAREIVARVHDEMFLNGVADDVHADAGEILHAVTARAVKDSRLVEVGVSLPDRALAMRVCNAILDHVVAERIG